MLSIKFYCPRWGAESTPWPLFCQNVKSAGFSGVEVFPLPVPHEKDKMMEQLEMHGLQFSLLHAELVEGKDFERYKLALERNLYTLVDYQNSRIKPQFITSQTGREYYTKEQVSECISICDRIAKESGIAIYQETHRNKWAYAAHVAAPYLEAHPSLLLTLDLSHWVCVSESYLEDQAEAVTLAIQHTAHLHARVGHTEGPQVTDPRAPENAVALSHHLAWWDQWIQHLQATGKKQCTITPEFGPYPYMSCHINTSIPVADQWEINCFIKDLLAERYKGSSATERND